MFKSYDEKENRRLRIEREKKIKQKRRGWTDEHIPKDDPELQGELPKSIYKE